MNKSQIVVIASLALLLMVMIVVSLAFGSTWISPPRIIAAILGDGEGSDAIMVLDVRLPRVLLGAIVGAALAAAGTAYQGLFRNSLADPFVIGAASGAAVGAATAIVLGWTWSFLGFGGVSLAALLGAMLAVAIVYGIAASDSHGSTTTLLLAGVAVSTFLTAVLTLVMILNEEMLDQIFLWLVGTLNLRGWNEFWTALPLITVGTLAIWAASRGLDALTFGEESATSLGLPLGSLRLWIVLAASATTAAAVAAVGIVGFIGLVAPHAARMLVGARHAVLLPASCLIGALLVVAADDIGRSVVQPRELPIGIVTAFLGAPFFLYLLRTRFRNLGVGE